MNVRLIQVDGKLPNLALMRLSAFHKKHKDSVVLSRSVDSDLFQQNPDAIYASTIFKYSAPLVTRLKRNFPGVVVGGTGENLTTKIEDYISDSSDLDYSLYPDFTSSIGFSMRGCRLQCGFCVVPEKEGRPVENKSINQIWRGQKYPKHIILLDNDFFGQPKDVWKEKIREMVDGNFKVSFNQGLNARLLNPEACHYLAKVKYYDDGFKTKRLYTAWDNLRDEKIFFRGVEMLEEAGISPSHLMVYMLIGYDPEETWERILHRFKKMVELGIKPYPMVYDRKRKDLIRFQRYVIRGYYRFIPWEKYDPRKQGKQDFKTEQKDLIS